MNIQRSNESNILVANRFGWPISLANLVNKANWQYIRANMRAKNVIACKEAWAWDVGNSGSWKPSPKTWTWNSDVRRIHICTQKSYNICKEEIICEPGLLDCARLLSRNIKKYRIWENKKRTQRVLLHLLHCRCNMGLQIYKTEHI